MSEEAVAETVEETTTEETQSNDNETQVEQTDEKQGTSESLLDGIEEGDGLNFDFTTGERPEGFPEDYWNEEDGGVNAQKLFDDLKKQEKIAGDLRRKMGKGEHKAPENAEDYKLELSEELSELIPSDDPLLVKAKERAHQYGMSQEDFQGFIGEIISDMSELAGESADPEMTEQAQKDYIQEQIKLIGPNGAQVLRSVESWGNELLAKGALSEGALETLKTEGMNSANMVKLMNEMRVVMGGGDVPVTPIDDGLPADKVIADKMNDLFEKARESGNSSEYDNYVADITERRKRAGRPDLLQF